ncbi:MAG TPA: T9SS type A sorting domain-containing protein [Saprospiraceae bacterium]|nr:T9SS type A sorting domain-containing protein [Saprospiraceae bacterium]
MNRLNLTFYLCLLIFTLPISINLGLKAQNIRISGFNEPNEPSIAIDPKDPKVMVAGANLDNYYISIDSGYTWLTKTLSSSFGVWGDPVLAVDTAGDFYFFHLSNPPTGSWIDRIVCQKSEDRGKTWSDGSFAGLNGSKVQDKQWCAIDRKNNHLYLSWTQFDQYDSADPGDSTVILFSKSVDAGVSWSVPKRINKIAGDCLDKDNTVEGAVPAVGPEGEIYISWAGPNGLVFNKSIDSGDTWLENEIKIDPMPGGWDFLVPGIYRTNGLPVTACDVSNGPNRGTIYVNWTDQRNGTDNTDVWLAKSLDGGQSWSAPIKVNDDNTGRHQFFTWMAIDQNNGHLYFVFYDRRNHSNNATDVYMALSMDGGQTFINRKISEAPFLPNENIFFGDYTNLSVHDGVIRPIWTRLHNGELSIWTHIARLDDFVNSTGTQEFKKSNEVELENYPNPSKEIQYVSFKLHESANVNLSLQDLDGRIVAWIIRDEKRGYGKYIESINLSNLHLADGNYFIRLEVDGKVKVNRMVKI